jgi:hypothetical protein
MTTGFWTLVLLLFQKPALQILNQKWQSEVADEEFVDDEVRHRHLELRLAGRVVGRWTVMDCVVLEGKGVWVVKEVVCRQHDEDVDRKLRRRAPHSRS